MAPSAVDEVGPAGVVSGGSVPAPLDMAEVRRVEAHARSKLLLGQTPVNSPTSQLRREGSGGPLDRRGRHVKVVALSPGFQSAIPHGPPQPSDRFSLARP